MDLVRIQHPVESSRLLKSQQLFTLEEHEDFARLLKLFPDTFNMEFSFY